MFLTKGEQQITWEGLYNRSKLLGEIPDEKLCKTIIKTYDSDGDGKLSFEDFKMVM
jgi:Ca2+-binding EF-hand superfamily protein